MTFTPREPALVLCDIIQDEMELLDEQCVVYNQRLAMKTFKGLHVVVSYLSGRTVGTKSTAASSTSGMLETKEVAVNELYQIDIMSEDESARTRKEEIISALISITAQQYCEKYHMQIANVPANFIDTSELEGAARQNRYSLTIAVNAIYIKTKEVECYSTFPDPETWVDKKPEV